MTDPERQYFNAAAAVPTLKGRLRLMARLSSWPLGLWQTINLRQTLSHQKVTTVTYVSCKISKQERSWMMVESTILDLYHNLNTNRPESVDGKSLKRHRHLRKGIRSLGTYCFSVGGLTSMKKRQIWWNFSKRIYFFTHHASSQWYVQYYFGSEVEV